MKRDGWLAWYSPKTRRRAAPVRTSFARARHADVAEPAFFLELRLVLARSRMREQPFLEAGENHNRKLEPLRAVKRHQPDARVLRSLLFIGVREQRQPVDESVQRRLRLAAFVLSSRGDELGQVLDAPFGVFAPLVAQVLQVPAADRKSVV